VHPVCKVLAARASVGSQPGRRDDPYRVVLAIEGGGSRGAFCSGMVLAIEQQGLLPCFDDVYASSSGALNGAWLLSRQAARGVELWRDPSVLGGVIDPLRVLRGGPIIDTDYLVHRAPQLIGGMDYQALLDNPVTFHPLATDAATGAVVDLQPFLTGPEAVRTALRATTGLPLVAGPAVSFGGRQLFDGGLAESIPFHTAARQGATHILVLRTRRTDEPATRASWGELLFIPSYLAVRGRGAIGPWSTRYRRGLVDEQLLTALSDNSLGDAAVLQIRPPLGSPSVPRTSRDAALLDEAVSIGLQIAHDVFASFAARPTLAASVKTA
jgi:predicted patatin/cPLA2 family phospholipase